VTRTARACKELKELCDMAKQIKTGIIGQGRSGRDIHGVYLCKDDRFKIVAVADTLAERRQRAVQEYGCAAYATHVELLQRKDLDLVVNASFSHQHTSITKDILTAGCHVVCEKPLARNVAMVDEMIAAAKKSGRVFAVFQQSRYAPYFQQVQKDIFGLIEDYRYLLWSIYCRVYLLHVRRQAKLLRDVLRDSILRKYFF